MRIPPKYWMSLLLKTVNWLQNKGFEYVIFGSACFSLLVRPVATKDIDILIRPFPSVNDASRITMELRNFLNGIRAFPLFDAVEGDRIIVEVETPRGLVGVELWSYILREKETVIFIDKSIEVEYCGKKLRVLPPEIFLATKLCEITPEPADKEKIDELLEANKEKLSIESIIWAMRVLKCSGLAESNIDIWYGKNRPKLLQKVLEKLTQ